MTGPIRASRRSSSSARSTARRCTALAAAPDMTPDFVAFPGTDFSTTHHYMIAMHGDAPLTARLIQPVLVDAETGALTEPARCRGMWRPC